MDNKLNANVKANENGKANAKEEPKTEPPVEVLNKCNKCSKTFVSEQALKKHRAFKNVGCIGAWHICKRCFQCFDHLSDLRKHQSTVKLCDATDVSVSITKSAATTLSDTVNRLRLRKGVNDVGSVHAYFHNVIKRGNQMEVHNTLEACTLSDLAVFQSIVEEQMALDVLGQMANFANKPDVSSEKAVLIKAFILKNTTL